MNKDKIIKDLKERNDKLANQYRLRDIRCVCLEKEIESLQQENKQLKIELQEANDNIIWWCNRFKAVERDNRNLKNEIQLRIKSIEKLENNIIEYQRKIQELKEKYK